jgi:predicted GTPase
MEPRRVVIMGAAGRDFHDFNMVYRSDPAIRVVAFTATQIPGIAGRRYPAEIAGPAYPRGIPIFPEAQLERLIRDEHVDQVVFAYSDVSHETVMHAASRVLAAGADFALLGPHRTMLESARPVIAVGATRTGAGKSQTTRYVAGLVEARGLRPVVIRHPMPYGDLVAERLQRFASYDDLAREHVTIEEREEYEPHLAAGRIVYAGVDYAAILRKAETEADVLLWDGGNNDFPFVRPDWFLVVADPLRAGDEYRYHPGETNVRMADAVLINKVDSATTDEVDEVRAAVVDMNPRAEILMGASDVRLSGPPIAGRRVVVVEDGPTLTHGGMTYGAGIVAAHRFGAMPVDPRPAAVGAIRAVFDRYPHVQSVVPAMGYDERQVADLVETLDGVDADLVLAATPIDLAALAHLRLPVTRVAYDLVQVSGRPLDELLEPVFAAAAARRGSLAGSLR